MAKPPPAELPPALTVQRSGIRTVLSLLPYLWPAGNPVARLRVVVAMLFLVLAKGATVIVPVIYGRMVDALAPKGGGSVLVLPMALIVAYGLARVASAGFGELRDALFASVGQRAVRQLSLRTFRHLHALSLRFHLDRQTGGLARVIDRGTTGTQSVLRLAVFNVVPTMIELTLVTAIIWRLFDWRFAAVTLLAVLVYVGFTATFAARRVRLRRAMNDTDNDASSKALDSLLNFETVKYFGNEAHEAARYDASLARYERAAVRVQVSLNMLNLGQAMIIAIGLTLIMLMAANGVRDGSMTVGKFVLINTYLMQLYQPLNFLGMVYMTIRQGLVDMEQMFRLLRVPADVTDRPGATALAATSVGRAGVRGAVRERLVRLRPRPHHPARRRFRRAGGRQAGDRRADRRGQIHDQQAAVPLLRRDRRAHPDRRAGHSRRDAGEPARGDRRGAAGHRAVQRHDPLQHRLWPARCVGGGDRSRRRATPRCTISSCGCRRATTRGSASAG